MASKRRTLYTGVTGFLRRRVFKHKLGIGSMFTAKYNCTRCVHFEVFQDVVDAIAREKEIKGWLRKRKIALIEESNPDWTDKFDWLDEHVEIYKKKNPQEIAEARAEILRSSRKMDVEDIDSDELRMTPSAADEVLHSSRNMNEEEFDAIELGMTR